VSAPTPPQELLQIQRKYNGYLYWDGREWVLGLPQGTVLTPTEMQWVSYYNAKIIYFKGPITFIR
jgi:hypothetical protein